MTWPWMGKDEAASGPWGLNPGGRASGMVHSVMGEWETGRGGLGDKKMNVEHPPAMHSVLGWH